jgi:hypothetical protein
MVYYAFYDGGCKAHGIYYAFYHGCCKGHSIYCMFYDCCHKAHSIYYAFYDGCCKVHSIYCTFYDGCRKMHSIYCTFYDSHCKTYSIYYMFYDGRCKMHSIYYTFYDGCRNWKFCGTTLWEFAILAATWKNRCILCPVILKRGEIYRAHSRNIYLKFERKNMHKLNGIKILPLILRVPGLSWWILCRIFFSFLNATDQNPGMFCNGIFF